MMSASARLATACGSTQPSCWTGAASLRVRRPCLVKDTALRGQEFGGGRHVPVAQCPASQAPSWSIDTEHTSKLQQPLAAQHKDAAPYSWTKQWWPVFPVFQLDKLKPHPVTMLGKDYVIWWNEAASQWSVLEDRCPHRLAQLSAGRIVEGKLTCSYHGWQFNGGGSCVAIPQIGDQRAAAAALSSPRTCVSSFPTRVEDGLLFAWLDSSPNAAAEAKAAEKSIVSEHVAGAAGLDLWACSTMPNDYTFWLEQGMDPSHAPFLHDGMLGFDRTTAVPMAGGAGPVDLKQGFTWQHGAYDATTANIKATREFRAPYSNIVEYIYPPKAPDDGGTSSCSHFQSMIVPVMPGVCRTIGKSKVGKHPDSLSTAIQGIFGRLAPSLVHVAVILLDKGGDLPDQDKVILTGQEMSMRTRGLTRRDYRLFSQADEGVKALRRWFELAGYEDMWQERQLGSAAGWQPKSLEQQLSCWESHTKDCRVCQQAYGKLTQLCNMMAGIGVALGVIGLTLIAEGHGADLRGIALAAVGGMCFWARKAVIDLRDLKLVSSAKRWRAVGGLSHVRGVPIKL